MKLKILPFLLPGIVIIYYLCRHFELYFTYLILISITIFVQCYFLTKPLISSLNKIFFAKINLKFRMDYKGLLVAALFVICFFYLLFSYFNTRVNSYDGMYHNLKFILAISDKGYVNSTEYPLKPYLGEVILSFIYSNFGLRFLNLALGILFIATCFIGYRFITYFATDTKLRIISFIVFIFAPTSIAFAFIELKSDLIASLLVVYSFILLKNLIDKKERFEHYLISIFLSIAVLIKTTTIPISILILIFAVYFVFKNSIGIKTFILKIFLMTFLYFIPIFIWFIHFGGTIPQFENKLNISSYHSSGKFFLKRDTDILEICNEEKVVKDYSSFIYGSRSILVFFSTNFLLI